MNITDRSRPAAKRDTPPEPPVSADDVLDVEGLTSAIHEEQIALMQRLIRETPDDRVNEKAEYQFILGEIWAKLARFHRLEAIRLTLNKGATAKIGEHTKQAKDSLVQAVIVYKALTDEPRYANYPQMDTALFYYAYTLQHGGYPKEARTAYDKLLRNYPKSKYSADAHLAFAEAHFEANEWADAEARYKRVLQFPTGQQYWYAMYKLGWVQLKQTRAQEALELFYQVAQGTKNDPKRAVLNRASKHDFVRAYAEVGRADKAYPAFQRVDSKDPFGMLTTLGELYLEQGKHDKAIFIFRQAMKEKPTHASVCVWEHAIAKSMLVIGTPDEKIGEIENLVKLYANLRDKKVLPKSEAIECHDDAAEMSGQLARAYHQEALKTQNPAFITYANRLYKSYLAAFKDAPDYNDTLYFHAELGWIGAEMEKNQRLAAQKWEDVARTFTSVAEAPKMDPKRVQVAADAAMLAWLKAMHVNPLQTHQTIDDAKYNTVQTPKPIPGNEQNLLSALDGYLRLVKDPNDEERVYVMFQKGVILHRYDHHDDAIAIFTDIVKKYPKHEAAEDAAQLALDSFNQLQHYEQMLGFCAAMGKPFQADHEHVKATCADLGRTAMAKSAEVEEAEAKKTKDMTKFVSCGVKYLEAYNADVFAKNAATLLYNSGVCFEQGHSFSAAKQSYELVQQLFGKTEKDIAARATVRLGDAYASIAYYREAAERLEEYAVKYAGEDNAFRALSDAVQFRKGIGDDDKAIEDTNTFIRLFGTKRGELAAAAHFSMIGIYEKKGDLDALARHLRAYIDRWGKIGGADKLVMAYGKLGQALWQSACPVPTVDGACMKMSRISAIADRARAKQMRTGVRDRCGEEERAAITMVPRDERKVRDSLAAYGKAVATYDAAGKLSGDTRGALYYYALAKFGQVENSYEKYLATPIPTNLDFDPRQPAVAKKSQERFETWFKKKLEQSIELRKQYLAIKPLGDGAVSIASVARVGEVSQNFSAQLYRAEIPANLRVGPYAADATDAYCEKLEKVAEPLEKDSVEAYKVCLETSTALGWFSEWSRLCERELGQIQPLNFPTLKERRSTPEGADHIGDTEGAVAISAPPPPPAPASPPTSGGGTKTGPSAK